MTDPAFDYRAYRQLVPPKLRPPVQRPQLVFSANKTQERAKAVQYMPMVGDRRWAPPDIPPRPEAFGVETFARAA